MNTRDSLNKDIDNLLQKASEANSMILSEIMTFIDRVNTSSVNTILSAQGKQMISHAAEMFTRLHIKHTSEFLDMLVLLSKELNQPLAEGPISPSEGSLPLDQKRVEISLTALPDQPNEFSFILNNDKNLSISSRIEYTAFTSVSDPSQSFITEILFDPYEFKLAKGIPQRINGRFSLPSTVSPGVYRSHLNTTGQEQVFFDLVITVNPIKTENNSIANENE